MRKLLILSSLFLSIIAISAEDKLEIPGIYIQKGETVACNSEGGCLVMTPGQLEKMANSIYFKSKEMLDCRKIPQI